ncbi:hypothetical protein NPIL_673271 [Nephila pilipes]|uniref:Uncharacterized protein n=1 Tax=Nephila pilipes TaxID=299642 RepID=A0A8X6TBL8_NEPPI|nr:hypothetical protein NPIL_673271 [Nephila pilipes]
MYPDERPAGLWMVSPVSLEPRLSLALWSLREAIFFCAVKLSGSFFVLCPLLPAEDLLECWICRVFSFVPSCCGTFFISTWTLLFAF